MKRLRRRRRRISEAARQARQAGMGRERGPRTGDCRIGDWEDTAVDGCEDGVRNGVGGVLKLERRDGD
jgi:hypothetical protein